MSLRARAKFGRFSRALQELSRAVAERRFELGGDTDEMA